MGIGACACRGNERITTTKVTLEESYIAKKQEGLGIHKMTIQQIITQINKHSKNGKLTPLEFYTLLLDLGLLRRQMTFPMKETEVVENIINMKEAEKNIKWIGFYNLFEQKSSDGHNYYDSRNLTIAFTLLTNDETVLKISTIYETLDYQNKMFVTAKQVRSFFNEYCLIAARYLTFYARDFPYDDRTKFNLLLEQWQQLYILAASQLTKKLILREQYVKREDFFLRLRQEYFREVFNAITLRTYILEQSNNISLEAIDSTGGGFPRNTFPSMKGQSPVLYADIGGSSLPRALHQYSPILPSSTPSSALVSPRRSLNDHYEPIHNYQLRKVSK